MRFLFIVKAPQTRNPFGDFRRILSVSISALFDSSDQSTPLIFANESPEGIHLGDATDPAGIFALGKHAGEDFEFEGYRVPAGTDVLHVNTLGHFLEGRTVPLQARAILGTG